MSPTIASIQRATCATYGLKSIDMTSRRRRDARPRQVAIYLSRRLTAKTLPTIARYFGNRDHTTILHAVNRIDHLRARDIILDREIREIENLVGCDDAPCGDGVVGD